jgi:hypothetical protein
MHDPLAETRDFLISITTPAVGAVIDATTTTRGTSWPTVLADGKLFVQYAFDGSASDADNREDAAVRITVWAAKNHPSDAIELAGLILPRFSAWSSAKCWRVDRGPGRLAGVDPQTQLPFCYFTRRPQMRVDEPA